jgi:hypothetical protein
VLTSTFPARALRACSRYGASRKDAPCGSPALHAEMTVGEVADLDLGYSPPSGPGWDPVLTAAKALSDDLD